MSRYWEEKLPDIKVEQIRDADSYCTVFAEWRNHSYKCFTSQAKVTPETTKLWIESKRGNETLYGVYAGKKIAGHFTVSDHGELGAVLKDPSYEKPIMREAILGVIKSNPAWLIVLADNVKAIKFYESMGFKKTGEETHNELLHYRMEKP